MNRILILGTLCILTGHRSFCQYKQEYVQKYLDIAISEMHRTGIPASIKLSQAILESNYGRSELAREAHNHFGIKCGREWGGKGYSLKDDDRDARGELVHSCFRVFKSDDESFMAHSDFLMDPTKVNRYGCLFSLAPDDYKGWAEGLKRCGYATNPEYARLLIRIIEEQGLYNYDVSRRDEPLASNNKRNQREDAARPDVNLSNAGRQAYTIQFQNSVPYITTHHGDNIKSISKQTDVSQHRIIKYNEIVDNRRTPLEAGDHIYLQPLKRKYKGTPEMHISDAGETMATIAHFYGVKSDVLRKRNNIPEGCEPAPGSRIVLRGKQRHEVRCASDVPVQLASTTPARKTPEKKTVNVAPPATEVTTSEPTITRETPKDQVVLQAKAPAGLSDVFVKDVMGYTVQPKDTLYQIASAHGITVSELKLINNLTSDTIHPGQSLKVQK